MRILVIGKGAREDTFVWFLRESGETVFAAPGNPGMEKRGAICHNIAVDNLHGLLELALLLNIDLVVVGPEAPLKAGIVDVFTAAGIPIVGPTQAAAELEWSKAYAKAFMARHFIPTAKFRTFHVASEARDYLSQTPDPFLVVKVDGPAEGKGVVVAENTTQAIAAVDRIMVEKAFGEAGNVIVLEERLVGTECSFHVLCDGENIVSFRKSKDWKRRFEGDRGPNTGSMGGIFPVYEDHVLDQRILDEIIYPVIRGMAAEGRPYRGFLYVGLMLTAKGPKVVEFNVRFGDPEACVTIPMLALDQDFAQVLLASTSPGGLGGVHLKWRSGYAAGVEVAQNEYPSPCTGNYPISGIAEAEQSSLVFYAGTAMKNGKLVTNGGRVLIPVGRGRTVQAALGAAYESVNCIVFPGADCRRDIGKELLVS